MARYKELFEKCSNDLHAAERALATAARYREFINETGRAQEFIVWWAEQQGVGPDGLAALRTAIAGVSELPSSVT